MLQRDRRFRRLFRILDAAGLTWLSDEVRALCAAPQGFTMSDGEVGSMRAVNALRVAPSPRGESSGSILVKLPGETAPEFDACISYILVRIDDVAAYLATAALLAVELGVSGVQLGEGSSEDFRHEATFYLLKDVAAAARSMVES